MLEMTKLKSERISINLDAVFAPPIFQRNEIPHRFFDLVYSSLTPNFTVDPNDLEVLPGNKLGDVVVKYKIFGGNSSISMSPDKLSAQFPSALHDDFKIIKQLLNKIGTGFSEKFMESNFCQMQVSLFEHAKVVSGGSASKYLAQFEIPAVKSRFSKLGISYKPEAKFIIFKADWQAHCSIEQSLLLADGLFLNYDVTMNNLIQGKTIDQQMELVEDIMKECASALELDFQ